MTKTTPNPVRELRESLGLSQLSFAQATNVSSRTISEVERGGRAKLPPKFLAALADLGLLVDGFEESYETFLGSLRAEVVAGLRARQK